MLTPYLLLDVAIARENILRMAQKTAMSGVLFRPHFKTHQSALVGEWFRDAGVETITVSSLKMANYFALHGWSDITIGITVNRFDYEEIDQLSSQINLNIVVEDVETVLFLGQRLSHPVGVFIKIDTGYHRTGVDADDFDSLVGLMDALHDTRNLIFIGLLTHSGHTYHARSVSEIFDIQQQAFKQMLAIKTFLFDRFPLMQLSYGDTPSCSLLSSFKGMDEVRPGNFVFNDLMQCSLGVCSLADIALVLVTPVLALHAERGEAVIHGGAVHLSKESIADDQGVIHYGIVVELNGNQWNIRRVLGHVTRISQEHGIVSMTPLGEQQMAVGVNVAVLPVHSCLTANLMRRYVLTSGEVAEMMP